MKIDVRLRIAMIERIAIIKETARICRDVGCVAQAEHLETQAEGIRLVLRRDRNDRAIGFSQHEARQ